MGLQTKKTSTGRVVLKRDPITGNIIKDSAEADKVKSGEEEKKSEYKRYRPPPKEPSLGEKIGNFFKNLFGKK